MKRLRTLLPSLLIISALMLTLAYTREGLANNTKTNPSPDAKWWQAGPDVKSIVIDSLNRKVFLGGNITYMGPGYNYAMGFDIHTGEPSINYPRANRTVRAAVPDGNGGWFIAGDFNRVGNEERFGIAQIDSQGNVTPFLANTNNLSVDKILLVDNILYAGGSFSSINGVTTSQFAAINVTTGQVVPLNVTVNNRVYDLAVHNNVIYFAGAFTTVSGVARNRMAAVNATTGEVLPFNPQFNNYVLTLNVFDNKLYVGGDFTIMGGETRNRAASFDLTDNSLTSWNPNVGNATVRAFAFDGEKIYMGGYFGTVAGQSRQRLAAFDLSTGELTSWNPQGDITGFSGVSSLVVSGENVIATGDFTGFNSEVRQGVAMINKTTGQLTDWQVNAAPGGIVHTASISGNTVFLGGSSRDFAVKLVNGLCALDLDTGQPVDWAPNLRSATAGGSVNSLLLKGDTLYVGGSFNTINAIQRANLASFNANTGELTDWNPNPLGNVWGLGYNNGMLYVGGNFNLFGSVSRPRLASFNHKTGELTDWAPTPNGVVNTFAFHGNTMYIGGSFTQVSGETRQRLAAFDISDGSILPWNPEATRRVNKIVVVDNGESLLIGGDFDRFNGEFWGRFVKLQIATNDFSAWKPSVFNEVQDIVVSGNTVYITGNFTSVENQSRRGVAALDLGKPTNMLMDWGPSFRFPVSGNPTISAVAHYKGKVFIGGDFQLVNDIPRFGFAVFPDVASTPGTPTSIEVHAEKTLFHLFPNPAKDRINISFNGEITSAVRIEIFDLHGRLVRSESIEASHREDITVIDLNGFIPGLYFARISDGKTHQTLRFIRN